MKLNSSDSLQNFVFALHFFISCMDKKQKSSCIGFVSAKCMADTKHLVLTLVKIKYRTPEMRLNPSLIYLSILEQMHVELTDKNIDAHGSTGVSYEF